MQGFAYIVAAYIAIWVGILLYLGFITLRMQSVHTEMAAIEELVHEQQKNKETA